MKKKRTGNKRLSILLIAVVAIAYYLGLIPSEWVSHISTSFAQSNTLQVYEGVEIPITSKDTPEQLLQKMNYTVSFNPRTNIPNWVAWTISEEELIERESRTNNFLPDPALPDHLAVTTQDYTGSGYDRGHMCPAADNKFHWRAMDECFYMTNICPQNHNLNAGVWSSLEHQCREWAEEGYTVHVACGPILDSHCKAQYIGDRHKVRVPDGFFKVVLYGLESNQPKAFGFIFENKSGKKPLIHYARTVDEIEALTGHDFFASLDDILEQRLEATRYDL